MVPLTKRISSSAYVLPLVSAVEEQLANFLEGRELSRTKAEIKINIHDQVSSSPEEASL